MTLINDSALNLGDRIKLARVAAHMRQQDLADILGVTRQAVAQWETGSTEPSASKFVGLARATNQPLDWFAEGLNAEARPKGLEPLTFWMGVEGGTVADAQFWTIERKSALLAIECQLGIDAEFFGIVGVE